MLPEKGICYPVASIVLEIYYMYLGVKMLNIFHKNVILFYFILFSATKS